ncbi:MAG: diguanylate cyclase domain-containing protein, partial [Terriglobales bacterium]
AERDPVSNRITDFHLSFANDNGARLAGATHNSNRLGAMPHFAHSGFYEAFLRVITTQRALDDEMTLADRPSTWLHRQVVALGDGVAMTVRDISERKRAEEQLRHLAQRDALTGLANRRTFLAQLEHAMAASRRLRHQALLAVLFLDLDRFKQVNDTLGHAQGDRLLQTVAERLSGCVRSADTVARMGGDEFTLLLENLEGREDAERVVHCIFRSLESPVVLGNASIMTSASIGVAYYEGEELSPHDLVARADAALYAAKRAGRNDFRVFAA